MILALTMVLMFGFGASATRLITKDKLLAGFRDRWAGHFTWRQGRILAAINAETSFRLEASRNFVAVLNKHRSPDEHVKLETLTAQQMHDAMLHEVGDRADEERPLPVWAARAKREQVQPWTVRSNQLARLRSYIEFIGCPFCVGFWVFAATLLWTWGRCFGFAYDLASARVALPVDYVVVAGALAGRWLYALIAMRWDNGH
jgi:hypothetical protein